MGSCIAVVAKTHTNAQAGVFSCVCDGAFLYCPDRSYSTHMSATPVPYIAHICDFPETAMAHGITLPLPQKHPNTALNSPQEHIAAIR